MGHFQVVFLVSILLRDSCGQNGCHMATWEISDIEVRLSHSQHQKRQKSWMP